MGARACVSWAVCAACVSWVACVAAGTLRAQGPEANDLRECPNCEDYELNIVDVGKMLGFVQLSNVSRKEVASFLGIPFSSKPQRFEPPEKLGPWAGVRDARVRAPACPQGKFYPWDVERDDAARSGATFNDPMESPVARDDHDPEDCLTLDVYTPTSALQPKREGPLLPVLFWIHGGAFVRGSSVSARPDFLLDALDVVIVAPQYRLGTLGFLAPGGHSGGKGNQALWDQALALQWAVDHVAAFGGDPQRIVVGGVSAGGATSGLLYVSPRTTGSIHAGVLCSGTAVSPWAVDAAPRASVKGIARFAGCADEALHLAEVEWRHEALGTASFQDRLTAENELRTCLDEAPLDLLLNATFEYAMSEKAQGRVGLGGTLPVLDGDAGFLPRPPRELLSADAFAGRPLLIGVTRDEGLYLEVQVKYFYLEVNGKLHDEELMRHGMGDLLLHFAGIEENLSSVLGYNVQKLYWREEQLGNYSKMEDGVIDFTGAGFFKGPAREMALLNAARNGSSWVYTFDYEATQLRDAAAATGASPRANHGHDQVFLFPSRTEDFQYSSQDLGVVERFTGMMANFINRRDPRDAGALTVQGQRWPPMTLEEDHYMAIGYAWEARSGWSREYHATNAPAPAPAPTPTLALVLTLAVGALVAARR